jgi:hypothetical protein
MAESRQIPVAGNFRKRKENASEISFSDFSNPWTFYALFSRDDLTVATWLIEQGLLGRSRPCERADCDGDMRLARRSGRLLGYTLRCNRSRDHEVSIMKYSFFERSKLDVRDIMQLIKTYLEGLSLGMTSRYAGVSYTGTAVDWGSFIRELMKEYFHVRLSQKKMSGIVEIDESLFGRRVKFHRGDPNKGLKVWVFGMVERSTNSLILYRHTFILTIWDTGTSLLYTSIHLRKLTRTPKLEILKLCIPTGSRVHGSMQRTTSGRCRAQRHLSGKVTWPK